MSENKGGLGPLGLILGIGAVGLLIKELFFDDNSGEDKRIFISFAQEDARYRDFLVAQAKNERSPFTFVDMSVKEPWDEKVWKRRCRKLIRTCDGMIVLLSNKTWHAGGSRWEMKCANQEDIPMVGMHIKKEAQGAVPPELDGSRIITWSWDNLAKAIKKV